MDYKGEVILESLSDRTVLDDLFIVKTKSVKVDENHQTPWLKHWTIHIVEIPKKIINQTVLKIAKALEGKHPWYADFKNDKNHIIIFKNRIFTIDREKPDQYNQAIEYGVGLGIPKHQLDFSL